MESRYGEDRYLASYCLDSRIFDEYDIEVNDVVPLRNVYILFTNRGKKIFKKLAYGKERLSFIEIALDYVKRSYPYVIEFERSSSGDCFIEHEKEIYVLINVIEGRECEVYNPVDIIGASSALARLHSASLGIVEKLQRELISKEENVFLGRLEGSLRKDLNLIADLQGRLKEFISYNEFDKLFDSSAEEIRMMLYKCIELLGSSGYQELCSDKGAAALCHGDLAHHNIIIKGEEVWFLDFDYCTVDLRVKDIADFIDKSIKGCGYDMDKCRDIIENYNKVAPLTPQEMKVLYIYLMYPRDLISLLRGYYNKEKNWEDRVFLDRFTKKLRSREEKELFLEEFFSEYLS
ncbi:MAG: CotS family spore coat protein [Clostridiaceae bacterium]